MATIVETILRVKGSGAKVLGCFPLYPPRELFHSFGLVPLVLWDLKETVGAFDRSDRHIQPFACSVARRLAEFLLADATPVFDGLFMYNACDTLRNMPEIIEKDLGERGISQPFFRIHVPMVPRDRADSSAYLAARIRELIDNIEAAWGLRFSGEKFLASVRLYNEMRSLSRLLELHVAEGKVSYKTFSRIIREGYFTSAEEHRAALESAVSMAESKPADDAGARKVIISGILPPSEALIDIIEGAGMIVAGNDVATQARSYGYAPAETDDPAVFYDDFYRNHHPCTTLLHTADRRIDALRRLIAERGARGFIVIGEKFCEYEYLELPHVRKVLAGEGIADLLLEIGADDADDPAALRTRIEAFAELRG